MIGVVSDFISLREGINRSSLQECSNKNDLKVGESFVRIALLVLLSFLFHHAAAPQY